jgi:hypothetical protein
VLSELTQKLFRRLRIVHTQIQYFSIFTATCRAEETFFKAMVASIDQNFMNNWLLYLPSPSCYYLLQHAFRVVIIDSSL